MTKKIEMTIEQAKYVIRKTEESMRMSDGIHDFVDNDNIVLHAARMVYGQTNDWRRETATKCLVAMYEAGFDASVDHVEKIIERVDLLDAALKENK